MADLSFSYEVPTEVLEAAKFGRREGRWIRTKCPFCDPEGRKSRALALGETGWLCHRCHAEDHDHAERARLHLNFRTTGTRAADERRRREKALRIAEGSSAITAGDPVDRYLRDRRRLVPLRESWPGELRRARLWHPDTRREYVCMVALVRDLSGTIMAVHRTYLMDDGTRADDKALPRGVRVDNAKLSLGPLLGGHSVVLGEDPNADTIGIAEGLESTLAFQMRLRLPCRSGLNANGVRAMRVPAEVRGIYIGPDIGDKDRVGLLAAFSLQKRLLAEGRGSGRGGFVKILPPPLDEPGDWANWAERVATKV